MPGLKYIMENAVHPDLRLLRGKTIECISLIVLAVGQEKFMQDANSIMALFMKTQNGSDATGDNATEQFDDDDPQVGATHFKTSLTICSGCKLGIMFNSHGCRTNDKMQ